MSALENHSRELTKIQNETPPYHGLHQLAFAVGNVLARTATVLGFRQKNRLFAPRHDDEGWHVAVLVATLLVLCDAHGIALVDGGRGPAQ